MVTVQTLIYAVLYVTAVSLHRCICKSLYCCRTYTQTVFFLSLKHRFIFSPSSYTEYSWHHRCYRSWFHSTRSVATFKLVWPLFLSRLRMIMLYICMEWWKIWRKGKLAVSLFYRRAVLEGPAKCSQHLVRPINWGQRARQSVVKGSWKRR